MIVPQPVIIIDRGAGRFRLDGSGHLMSVNVRHAQIGDDHFVRLFFAHGRAKHFHPLFSAGGGRHPMFQRRETILQQFLNL